jgi:hypothetical protein
LQRDFDGASSVDVAEVMESALKDLMLSRRSFAVRTGGFFSDAGAMFDLWFGQIVGMDDFFGGVGQVFTGCGHMESSLISMSKRIV